jgi:hypothetical protein
VHSFKKRSSICKAQEVQYSVRLLLISSICHDLSDIFVALKLNRTADDWFTATVSGILFGLAFFAVQPSIGTNGTCLLN